MPHPISDLLAHMAWADGVALHLCAKADPDHGDLRQRWDHIAGVQEGFLKVLRGEDASWDPAKPTPAFEALRAWARRNHEGFAAFLEAASPADLERQVRIPWFPDPPCILPVSEALLQVVLHTQHHRAQVMTRLAQLGHRTTNVDYIIWVWKERPEPRW